MASRKQGWEKLTSDSDKVRDFAAQLVDADGAARILGISDGRAVRAYAARYDNFPRPLLPLDPAPGRTQYWWAPDVVRFRESLPTRNRSGDSDEASS